MKEQEWVEVVPHGLVGGMIPQVCLMVFKEKEGSKRFAISLSRLQGRISLQAGLSKGGPFCFFNELFKDLDLRIEKCHFLSVENGDISAQVTLKARSKWRSIVVNADDFIPFAVQSTCRFYCTDEFMTQMLDQKIKIPLKKEDIKRPLYIN